MRQSKLKASEIEEAELAEHKETQSRKGGYSMIEIRDRGWVRLSNDSIIQWPVDRPMAEGEVRAYVPSGSFLLDGKLYDVDEFRKYTRWV